MIREDFSAAAHQFFALARLLMSYEPRHGAVGLALSSGRYVDYRVGWNVIADGPHERFTWIDPTGTQPGLTTYERPTTVPESEIYASQNTRRSTARMPTRSSIVPSLSWRQS